MRLAVYTGEDLQRVPELRFEAAPEGKLTTAKWQEQKAHAAAAALHLDGKAEDGFLKALLKDRPDLAGLPFAMDDACRTKRRRAAAFQVASKELAEFMERREQTPEDYAALHANIGSSMDRKGQNEMVSALMPVLRQVGPIDPTVQEGTVAAFAAISHPQATRELARLAVFSPHASVREAALKALSLRRERDYTAALLDALNYPWPAVARNAAEAIVKLERNDLLPHLIDMLESPDPRRPQTEEVGGKKVKVARELVRINHHHNCLLCHAPAERGNVPDEVLVAEVPLPSEPLPRAQRYGKSDSILLVRIDVTYLRQDFSVMQEVEEDEMGPWPAKQRFDFVVRKRPLTDAEAEELRKRLEDREPGVLSPYQKAAVNALRELTGRDFEAKAAVWRRYLKLRGL